MIRISPYLSLPYSRFLCIIVTQRKHNGMLHVSAPMTALSMAYYVPTYQSKILSASGFQEGNARRKVVSFKAQYKWYTPE